MINVPNAEARRLLANMLAGDLANCTIHLFTNDVVPGPLDTQATYTEATFNGYAAAQAAIGNLLWGSAYTDANDVATAVAQVCQFEATDGTIVETVRGYYVMAPAIVGPPAVAARLAYAERFDTPQPITRAGDAIVLIPRFTFSS